MNHRAIVAAVLMGGVAGSACLVQIEHVKDAGPAFAAARAEAERFRGRSGPAREVNVLVYDPDDRELVRASVPMWIARKLCRHAERDNVASDSAGAGEDRAERTVRRHVGLEDLERAGLGVLVEVEEDGGHRVLVWLR